MHDCYKQYHMILRRQERRSIYLALLEQQRRCKKRNVWQPNLHLKLNFRCYTHNRQYLKALKTKGEEINRQIPTFYSKKTNSCPFSFVSSVDQNAAIPLHFSSGADLDFEERVLEEFQKRRIPG